MTPTLFGRWQTRTLLFLTVGLFITFFFALFAIFWFQDFGAFLPPFIILFFILITGYGWDVVYTLLQHRRWDRDWPPVFHFLTGVVEMVPAWIIAALLDVPWWLFLLHYWFVWWGVYIWIFGPMRILSLRWRYHGGQWL